MLPSKPSLIILIYGIGRSTKHTHDSINSFIYLNKKYFDHVSVYYNLLVQDEVSSHRTNEFSKLNISDANLIKYNKLNYLYESDFDYSDLYNKLRLEVFDVYNDDYFTYNNLLRQLSILESFNVPKNTFSHFCLIRDDAILSIPKKFENRLFTSLIKSDELITSSFYWNRGICDRFLCGNISLLNLFLTRIKYILPMISRDLIVTGERLMKYVCKSNKISIRSYPIKISRIRNGGHVAFERHYIPFWSLVDLIGYARSRFNI